MKKQSIIIIALCVLVAAVIALSVLGVIGPKGSFAGYTGFPPNIGTSWDHSYLPHHAVIALYPF